MDPATSPNDRGVKPMVLNNIYAHTLLEKFPPTDRADFTRFLYRMKITPNDMDLLLLQGSISGNTFDAACAWIKNVSREGKGRERRREGGSVATNVPAVPCAREERSHWREALVGGSFFAACFSSPLFSSLLFSDSEKQWLYAPVTALTLGAPPYALQQNTALWTPWIANTADEIPSSLTPLIAGMAATIVLLAAAGAGYIYVIEQRAEQKVQQAVMKFEAERIFNFNRERRELLERLASIREKCLAVAFGGESRPRGTALSNPPPRCRQFSTKL